MNQLSPYLDWNIGVDKSFELKKDMHLGLSFKVMNVLNKNFEIIRSFPMPGRYYQLTLNYSFK
jgi:outer membrane cobalamin receptor